MIKINEEPVTFDHYNDGSCRAKLSLPSYGCGEVEITWLYENDCELLYLLYVVNHLHTNFYYDLSLNMPYVFNGRQDRTKKKEEIFTLKYSCELINQMNFKRVKIYDPHSSVTPVLLDRVVVESPQYEIQQLIQQYPDALLFFPDEGSMKRLHSLFTVPYAFGVKVRDWESQKIESLRVAGERHMIAGHDIIMCDDILSRGSTLYEAAKELKERGANNLYVWVSHCEKTVLGPHIKGVSLLDIPNLITKVYTTNSIFNGDHPKIEIIKRF